MGPRVVPPNSWDLRPCPSGTPVQPRPSMAPAEHPGISAGRGVSGRNLGWPGPGPQPGPRPWELSCEMEAPFLPHQQGCFSQPTNTQQGQMSAICPSPEPPFLLHLKGPVSAEDKSQGCGLSTRTQIRITIFYPRMTVNLRSEWSTAEHDASAGQKLASTGVRLLGSRQSQACVITHGGSQALLKSHSGPWSAELAALKGRCSEPGARVSLCKPRCMTLGKLLNLSAPASSARPASFRGPV